MSETVAVTPPDQTVWWDVPATVADALAVLRLTEGDVDAARITELVPVTGWRINERLDRTGPPPTPPPDTWQQALVYGVCALYRAKDSTRVDLDTGFGPGDVPVDPLAGVWPLLQGSRQRFGVG